jgi:hypothetical protein
MQSYICGETLGMIRGFADEVGLPEEATWDECPICSDICSDI